MPVSICPTEIAKAPAPAIWALVVDPLAYREWLDAHFVSVHPPGLAAAGQRMRFRAPTWGRWFRVDILVDAVDFVNRAIELTTRFPFGLVIKNRIAVAGLDAETSRVQFG